MNNSKKIVITIFFLSNLCGRNIDTLLDTLNQEKGWKPLNYLEDGTRFEIKGITGKTLFAVKVSKVTNIHPHFVRDVIMGLSRYGEFLSNANTITSELLKITDEFVDGYQHIQVALPFFSDRRYCFRMIPYQWPEEKNNILVEWYLLDQNGDYIEFLNQNAPNALYIDIGAGSWSAKALDDGQFEISYRLYMDPGGSIPKFLNQRINAISIINLFQDALIEADRRMKIHNHPKLYSPPNSTGLRSYRFNN